MCKKKKKKKEKEKSKKEILIIFFAPNTPVMLARGNFATVPIEDVFTGVFKESLNKRYTKRILICDFEIPWKLLTQRI